MNMTEFFAEALEREAPRSRKAVERVPEGKPEWKPHQKSMPLGYLAYLVASMPSWIQMAIEQDELDLAPGGGKPQRPPLPGTRAELLAAADDAAAKARAALAGTTDSHLKTPWRLLVAGNVVMENPRGIVIAETLEHLAHHRGQLTVYLRLLGEPVPALYGPSADDASFS
ncbi:MAG TPA: DinB family protein [Thermoanaerobaculia bacterium]|jgi:uncharacterized damage-inducible protein DinB